LGGGLDPVAVGGPLLGGQARQARVAGAAARGVVDDLAQDIRVAGVPGGLHTHVRQDLVQAHPPPLRRPPGHLACGAQRQRLDRRVGVCRGVPVQVDDLLAGLLGGRPHVRAVLSTLGQPGTARPAGRPKVAPK